MLLSFVVFRIDTVEFYRILSVRIPKFEHFNLTDDCLVISESENHRTGSFCVKFDSLISHSFSESISALAVDQ